MHQKNREKLLCEKCSSNPAILKRAGGSRLCAVCFTTEFEEDVWRFISDTEMFKEGSKIAVGVSGGKDSSVMAWVLFVLNKRHKMAWDFKLLSIDEGIAGYRNPSIDCVDKMGKLLGLDPLIVSFSEIFGTTTDEAAKIQQTEAGRMKSTCSTCGAFRRRALEIGSERVGVHLLAMGHNADDCAETALMNLFRGDFPKLVRCGLPKTGNEGKLVRCRPLMRSFQKEIVMYAVHNNLPFFSTECPHAPQAFRGAIRNFIAEVQIDTPNVIFNILDSAEQFSSFAPSVQKKPLGNCTICGQESLTEKCQTCNLSATLRSAKETQNV